MMVGIVVEYKGMSVRSSNGIYLASECGVGANTQGDLANSSDGTLLV